MLKFKLPGLPPIPVLKTLTISGVVGGAATAIGLLTGWVQAPAAACALPGVHAVCADRGWGGVANAQEEAVWKAAIASGQGDPLRRYLGLYPKGAYAAEAVTRLAGCRSVPDPVWNAGERRLPLEVLRTSAARATEGDARQEALSRGDADAATLCRGFSEGEYRLKKAGSQAKTWQCAPLGSQVACGFKGEAVCSVDVRVLNTREACGLPPP